MLPDVSSWREVYTKNARTNERAKYAKANWVDNRKLKGQQYTDNVDLICGTKNVRELMEWMNPLDEETRRQDSVPVDRYYAWNFENLKAGKSGTVEYRRPPGLQGANACVDWVRLAIMFVRAAIQVDDPHLPLPKNPSDVQNIDVHDLKEFLRTGLPVGHDMAGCFESFFDNKGGSLDVIPVKERYSEGG